MLFRSVFFHLIPSISMSTQSEIIDLKECLVFYDLYKFKGFDREKVRKEFLHKYPSSRQRTEILTLLCDNSPTRSMSIVMSDGKTLRDHGIISGNKIGLSPSRIITAFAKEIVIIRKHVSAPKRIINHDCPAEFQLLGVASVVPQELIKSYESFCVEFTKLISGVFKKELFELSRRN